MSAEKIWKRIMIFVLSLSIFFLTWTGQSQDGWGQKGSLEVKPETSPAAQAHLEPVAQDHLQMAFEDLQRWRLHHVSGQAVPGLSHSHSTEVFPDVPVCAHCLCSWHWEPLEEPGSILCAPSLYIFTGVDETWFSSSGWASQLSQTFLIGVVHQSLHHLKLN